MITDYQAKYYAYELTKRCSADSIEKLAGTLMDAQVDLNPHQVEAALFAFKSPLSQGAILADEVGLGKTIEAGLVLSQKWAEGKRRMMIIVPASLRKQWSQELADKFFLPSQILEAKSWNAALKSGQSNPYLGKLGATPEIIICSYPFAARHAEELMQVRWDLVVLDEAHRMRNVYKKQNKTARALRTALTNIPKILLTATPLQNSLMELYGLVSFIDEYAFGDEKSFKAQYARLTDLGQFESLKNRLKPLCHRTLRRQVLEYVKYTNRQPITQEFWPTQEEQDLYDMVSDYLQRPELNALPNSQRKLMTLVMRKLLASSTFAIAGALDSLANKLKRQLRENKALLTKLEEIEDDFETLDEYQDAQDDFDLEEDIPLTPEEIESIHDEVHELETFRDLAVSIAENAKGLSLLDALQAGLSKANELGAAQKAIIFTESRRTQNYLLNLLSQQGYEDKIVLFNGSNNDDKSKQIYKAWIEKHQGTDQISGSRTSDMRAALVDYFRDEAQIMIATEAAAEGINLQFCSLVVNYDLPWNPQRIEQRIGRCHRYGQKHDVVVINFLNKANAADQRVFELLDEKFNLFSGVFGASDEVLGSIESGVDFENRIVEIYQTCREPQQIDFQFEELRDDLDEQINKAMETTRQQLLESFDAEVHDKLKVNLQESKDYLDRYSQRLWGLTRNMLPAAEFDNQRHRFHLSALPALPSPPAVDIPVGDYEIGKQVTDAHIYRVSHPLAQWLISAAKQRELPVAHLQFDYSQYPAKAQSIEPWVNTSGWLSMVQLSVETFGENEDHIIIAAQSDQGQILKRKALDILLNIPASVLGTLNETPTASVIDQLLAEQGAVLESINQRNLGYFSEEIDKLDSWADDQKQGLEQNIKELEKAIKEVRKLAKTALTLEEKLGHQKQQRDMEAKRNKFRKELFDRQDEVDVRRDELIQALEDKLEQNTVVDEIFTIKWSIT